MYHKNGLFEMETEYALRVIKKQKESRVSIQKELEQNENNQQVALMIAHNINNFVSQEHLVELTQFLS